MCVSRICRNVDYGEMWDVNEVNQLHPLTMVTLRQAPGRTLLFD